MPRRSGTSWDFTGFSILGAMLNPVSSDPGGLTSGEKGRVWFNTTTNKLMVWNGTTAIDLLDRSVQTGSQTASTISDLAAVVKAYRLDEFAAPNTTVSMGSQRLINVADPSGAQDAATRAWVLAQLDGIASGQVLKGSVRVAATANVSIASAPAAVDGVTLANGDVVLLTGQSTPSQNGPRVFTAAGAALNRASNWDTSGEAVLGSYWIVREGTNADTFAMLTNDTAITLDTTAPTFVFRGAAGASYTAGNGLGLAGTVFSITLDSNSGLSVSGSGLKVDVTKTPQMNPKGGAIPAATSGIYTVAGAVVTVNHGLGNEAPDVRVVAGGTPASGYTAKQPVEVDWATVDSNNVAITLPAAPATGNWFVTIEG
jgi:hypothetical protein